MSHYTEGVLQAYLDDEVASGTRAAVAAHVDACTACASRLEELRELASTFTSAVQFGDVQSQPRVEVASLRARARRTGWGGPVAAPRTAWLRAASIVVAVSAVAAAAVPGSPVREWLASALRDEPDAPAQQAPSAPAPAVSGPEERGAMHILPADGRIKVEIQGATGGTVVRVHLGDDERASVEGNWQSLRTRAGIMTVVGGTGELEIVLPRKAQSATVEVDGRTYVQKNGDQLKFLGPKADTVGGDVVFRPGK